MNTIARDEITEINEAVGQRWRSIDPLLPDPGDLPEGCPASPLVATGKDGRPAGLAVCRHQHVPADSLAQTWDAATKFTLTMRLREADTRKAADDLLTQWRDHLADVPEAAREDDTSAVVTWPSRDVSGGLLAIMRHGLQPISVIAVRPSGRPVPGHGENPDLVIRQATPADLDAVTELELGVIHYDAHAGAAIPRAATPALTESNTRKSLEQRPDWTWLATRRDQPVGLAVVEPPSEAAWIAGMTRPGRTVYLSSMFIAPGERGSGTGAKLISHVHRALDERGIDLTLLHYATLNPLSGPFWHRMGYRPLWSTWEALPASTLRLIAHRKRGMIENDLAGMLSAT
jgi:GNAT superfamily N-acetyltransferase